jgi:2-phosphosulfolactate phosphatase
VLRASSTVVEALAAGARAIYPVSSIEEAIRLANTFGREEVLLCGERKCLPIEGFDLGNSPREFTPDRVQGKTLVMSTTNGTQVMVLNSGAQRVHVGSFLNLAAVVDALVCAEADPVLVCAGRERLFALEDAVCAGMIASHVMERRPGDWELSDGALAALSLAREFSPGDEMFASTAAGRMLREAGYGEDLAFCARLDARPLLPTLHERHITATPPPADAPE